MIDPIQSLAFSIQTNPGVYALLLGSGVSRSAGIPTGWEIIMDLLGKLAATKGQTIDADLESWYFEENQESPEYSKLLEGLAKTQSERQQSLRPYFEPGEREREEGLKQPTSAHRAIAHLVERGYIRVIVTTNFDRLMEKALEDVGVVPTVLSSVDQVQGALPLVHTRCCVVKLHGDYLDTRIRNSEDELSVYPQEFNDLLDRVLDEFGLIVCGWSADWDEALRKAIYRAKLRRFTTYWTIRGQPNEQAQRLIEHRQAEAIAIDSADAFFETVGQTVQSIDEYSRPHPMSIEAAVASLKRYLSGPEYRIRLMDLIDAEVERMVSATTGEGFGVDGRLTPNKELVTTRLRRYEAACTPLMAMASVAGFWAADDNLYVWERAMERLCTTTLESGYQLWLGLRTYPATLLLYALGLGAVESDRLITLKRILIKAVNNDGDMGRGRTVLSKLVEDIGSLVREGVHLVDVKPHYTPVSNWIHDVLRVPLKQLIPNDSRYSYAFDKFEMLVALGYYHLNNNWTDWFPIGAFIYRHDNWKHILSAMMESVSVLRDDSPYVASGIFGSTPEECIALIERFKSYIKNVAGRMGLFWLD